MRYDRNALTPNQPDRVVRVAPDGPAPRGPASDEFDPESLRERLLACELELSATKDALHRSDAALLASRSLYDRAPTGYCTLDAKGLISQANLAVAESLGLDRSQMVGTPIREFVAFENRAVLDQHMIEVFAASEPQSCDLHMIKQDGTAFAAHVRSVCLPSGDGGGTRAVYMTLSDASRNRHTEKILSEQKEFFRQIAENLSDFIAVLDCDGRRIYNSPSYEQLFGPPGDLRNTDSFAEIHPDDQVRIKALFRETVRTGQGQQIEYRFVLADGTIRHMESRGSVIRDAEGQVACVLVVSQDVTERTLLQEQIRKMAFHDHLTGLPNRHLFSDRLKQAMATNTRHSCHGALMFIDLDNFKPLNDNWGHEVGDLFLIEVANRLRSGVRAVDTVARFGGDEFVVMLSQLDPDESASVSHARGIAEKLLATMSEHYSLPVPHASEGEDVIEHRCTASIGVALFGGTDMKPTDILKRADIAMYRAKQAGGNQVLFFGTEASTGISSTT